MKKPVGILVLCSMLLVLAMPVWAQEAAAAGETDWQATCFAETPDYDYRDATRAICIKRYEQDGMVYFVADVQLAAVDGFRTALSGDQPFGDTEALSTMAARSGAVLAINGDDYGVHKFGTIIRNGALLRTHDTTRNMLIVDCAGDMSVRSDRSGEDPAALGQQLIEEKAWQTFEFGPELVRDGQATEFSIAFDVISTRPDRREPRTAIGQIGPLHYVIIVVDGRQDGYSKGMTLPELQQLFLAMGAQTAMNLDGGGSTELWFSGEILNRPAGGKERSLSDIIYF